MGETEKEARALKKRQAYRCFLIRCRLEEGAGPDGAAAWRFTVQQAEANAPRRTFTCFSDVAAYVETELRSCHLEVKP